MRGRCWGMSCWSEEKFGLLNFCCTRGEGKTFFQRGHAPFCIPHGGEHSPAPLPTRRGFAPLAPPFQEEKQELSCSLGDFADLGVTHPPAPLPRTHSSEGGGRAGAGGGVIFFILSFSKGDFIPLWNPRGTGWERKVGKVKSPSLLRAGGRCAGMVQPRGRWGPMPGSPLMGGRAL